MDATGDAAQSVTHNGQAVPPGIIPGDAWSRTAHAAIAQKSDDARAGWDALIAHAATAKSAKPSKKWLKAAQAQLDKVGVDDFKRTIFPALELAGHFENENERDFFFAHVHTDLPQCFEDRHAAILTGLAWCCSLIPEAETRRVLGEMAKGCLKKIPRVGAWSRQAGNAATSMLDRMPGLDGVQELEKLRLNLTDRAARQTIQKTLERVAKKEQLSVAEVQELGVPTFGLGADHSRTEIFGPFRATLALVPGDKATLTWTDNRGIPPRTKGVPTYVKEEFSAQLEALQNETRDLQKSVRVQKLRFERMFLHERTWDFQAWQQRYLANPLMHWLSSRLIWTFSEGEQRAEGVAHDGAILGLNDALLAWPTPATRVQLWTPLGAPADTVRRWREWLLAHTITQPFKQAHRESYVITDAERATATYSNRFAAHVLRQHQFAALCRERDWKHRLIGNFYSASGEPTLELPEFGLCAELTMLVGNREASGPGIMLHVVTGRLHFYKPGRTRVAVPLVQIPPRVFSEVMRDVDLFVGVCSVGNAPAGGGDAAYWRNYTGAALEASAQSRHAALEGLLPRLKIASRCTLDDRHLIVRGGLRTYKIHIGSGNIFMEPNNEYLCIVPGSGTSGSEGVRLPFEGDTLLSLILSKAFMLADDRSINDPSIVSQIVH